jgi:hypothetical protein
MFHVSFNPSQFIGNAKQKDVWIKKKEILFYFSSQKTKSCFISQYEVAKFHVRFKLPILIPSCFNRIMSL